MRMKKNIVKAVKGSLTVEAALVLPIFIYVIVGVVYFLQIISIQESFQYAITETGFDSAKYAYVYDKVREYETKSNNVKTGQAAGQEIEQDIDKESESIASWEAIIAKGINSVYYKIKMQDFLNVDFINNSCVTNGMNGVHTYLSSFMEEDEVDIILVYNINIPLPFINLKSIPVMQRIRMRGWSGHKVEAKNATETSDEENEGDEDIVFITETGSVYHLTKECTYLKLSIKEVMLEQVKNLRNVSGGIYQECSLCIKDGEHLENEEVYITNYGDRYHFSLNCSGLKRTILEIHLSEVGSRTLCTRCKNK